MEVLGIIFLGALVFLNFYEFMFPQKSFDKIYKKTVNDVNFNRR